MIRDAVSTFSRPGLLNANDTAVFDTPAASATSAIVTRRVTCCSKLPPQARNLPSVTPGLVRSLAAVYHPGNVAANRFSKPV